MQLQHPAAPYFDPIWRDDIFDERAIEASLALPQATPPNNRIWIVTEDVREEIIFRQHYVYKKNRTLTSVLKPSDIAKYYQATDEQGNIIPPDDPAMRFIFPPKSWMSDTAQERCMMYAAAKLAKGHVLIGGLGLGIYPQYIFALGRPVESITIIEKEPEIIAFVKHAWLDQHPDHAEKVTILEGTIEDFLIQTERQFDTIYLDTWEDADPRFLAHVNYLLVLASHRCTTHGQIQCWGYATMIDTFGENTRVLLETNFPWHEYYLDPVLQAFSDWLETKSNDVPMMVMLHAAKSFALTIQQSIDTYDRHRCFTGFGTSFVDAYRNMALSRKVREPESEE